MPDEIKQEGETPEVVAEKPTEQPQTETVEEKVEMSAEELARKLRNKEEEAARLHKKIEKFEAEEAERKKAAMTETERLQAELQEAKTQAAKLTQQQAQRDIAERVGLPIAFAGRLKGETPEELEADAKSLLESLPKGRVARTEGATPGEATQKGVTDDDRRKFLFGS